MKLTFSTATLLFASTAFAAPAPSPLDKLRQSTTGESKESSYIVKLKEGVSIQSAVDSLEALAFDVGDSASYKEVTYSDWTILNAYAAKLGGAALDFVLNDPDVEYVEEDGIFNIDFDPELVEVKEYKPSGEPCHRHARGVKGEGTNFYGVDTGILTTHNAFGGRVSWGATFGGYANRDGNGHGTHTAGSAIGNGYGPATAARGYSVKVLSDSGSGAWSDIISGINWSVNHALASGRPSVVNLSLGGGPSSSVDTAVSNGISLGVHFTIAAGNSNIDAANTSPARVANAVTVGAIDSSKRKASFSNYGAVLDVWYLGVNVASAWHTSNTAANTISGTSMAAPGVAGLILVYLGNNGSQSPAEVSSALASAAVSDVTGAPSGTTKLRAVTF